MDFGQYDAIFKRSDTSHNEATLGGNHENHDFVIHSNIRNMFRYVATFDKRRNAS